MAVSPCFTLSVSRIVSSKLKKVTSNSLIEELEDEVLEPLEELVEDGDDDERVVKGMPAYRSQEDKNHMAITAMPFFKKFYVFIFPLPLSAKPKRTNRRFIYYTAGIKDSLIIIKGLVSLTCSIVIFRLVLLVNFHFCL